MARLPWTSLICDVTGTLDRIDHVTSFTAFSVRATLEVPVGANVEAARQVMVRAEHACLISSSLKAACAFEPIVHVQEMRQSA